MQENIQAYIDAYSNFILNHLLLAENPKGVNVIELGPKPVALTFPTSPGGLNYTDLDYLFKDYSPIKLGDISVGPSYEISLYFLCTESKFNMVSADVFFDTYYQLTGSDYLIMTLYSHDTPVSTSKLDASSLATCSLNLGLQHDYEIYKVAVNLIRKMVIRFYSPTIGQTAELSTTADHYPPNPLPSTDTTKSEYDINEKSSSSILSPEELDALSQLFDKVEQTLSPDEFHEYNSQ